MEVVTGESVTLVAEELGVDASSVVSEVAAEVEYKLRQLVQDASKFMRRSRRKQLKTADVEHALRVRGWGSLHGFGYAEPEKFKFLQHQHLFFLEDEDVDLAKVLDDSEKLFLPTKVPLRPSFGLHWLAVDGVQPTIAENPHLLESQQDSLSAKAQVRSDPQHALAKHELSKELHIYYEKLVTAVIDTALGNRAAAESVYASLASDPGLQPLMPHLSKFVFDQVNKSLTSLALLTSVMRLARCVLVNPNLHKELYLHQLMPPILTCIVHRKLCATPFQNHWALRDFAASLVPLVCSQFGDTYKDIKPRVTKTLRDALLDKERPMTTQYGAIVGIAALGPLTVQSVLLPVLRKLLNRYNKVVANKTTTILKRTEAHNCLGALQAAFGAYLRACASPAPTLARALLLEEHYKPVRAVASAAGEATLPWTASASTSHLNLFI